MPDLSGPGTGVGTGTGTGGGGHDLVVAGGRVLDPGRGVDTRSDVGIDQGVIVAVGPDLAGREQLDATGLLVVPGLIDLHVHIYEGVSHYGIDADTHLLRRGTTTGVDAGSSGAQTFPGLRRYVIEQAETRLLAFLHIAVQGLISVRVGELEDLRWASAQECAAVARANPDLVIGVKVRAGHQMVGDDPRPAVRLARQAADDARLPVMVHIIDMRMPLPELLASLRAGDVVTHCFHGNEGGVLDERGRVHAEVFNAVERGVLFDIGHGTGSFSFRVARAALDQGLLPSTISSDIHAHSRTSPVWDLPTTMTKLLHLGVPLAQVVAMTTSVPATVVGRAVPGLGTVVPGGPADLTLLALEPGNWALTDGEGMTEQTGHRLAARSVVRAGRVHPCDPPPASPASPA